MALSLSQGQGVSEWLKRCARRLRAKATPAEEELWQALRGKRLNGLKFRRQQPVQGFVVDFYCEALDLAIELDGGIHDDPAVQVRDQEREAVLRKAGLRFLRFKNKAVFEDLPGVLAKIQAICPNPRPRREPGP